MVNAQEWLSQKVTSELEDNKLKSDYLPWILWEVRGDFFNWNWDLFLIQKG